MARYTGKLTTTSSNSSETWRHLQLQTFECNDFTGGVHDRRIGRDWASYRVRRVVEVDDDNLGRFADLLAHTDELIWLHRQRAEADVGRIDAQVLQLYITTISMP